MALICIVPSVIEFSKGYLVLSDLLFHFLVALLFSVFAVSFLSTVIAIFNIQNIERLRRRHLQELDTSTTSGGVVEGITRELPETTT